MSDNAGIPNLLQGLGRYLRRDRGDRIDRLVVDGRIRRGNGGLLAVRHLDRAVSRAGSEELAKDRAE